MKTQLSTKASIGLRVITFFILILASFITKAQPVLQWFNYPGGVSVALDSEENVYSASWDYNPAGDITLTKRDSSGNIIWEIPYNNSDNTRHEVATWVETDPTNNILVSGTIRSGFSSPVSVNGILMKYSWEGDLLWRVNTGADFDGSYTIKCVVDESSNIYVLSLANTAQGMSMQIKKYNLDGILLWTYNDLVGIGAPQNIKLTSDNAILVMCRNITGNINGVAKIDTSGNLVWNATGIESITTGDAIGDELGNTYIVHGTNLVTQNSTVLEKRSATGELIWQSNHPMSAFRVEIGPDQYPIIGGFPSSSLGGVAFAKFSGTGSMIWENNNADGPVYNLLAHAMMKIDANGATYLAGGTMSQMALCKVNSDGISEFTIESPSGYPADFDLGASNAIYLVGGTTSKFKLNELITSTNTIMNFSEEIILFPNPSSGDFNFYNSSEVPFTYWITDVSGRIIHPKTKTNQSADCFHLNDFSKGIYFFNYVKNDGSVAQVKRLIVH
jgi:hypothetical protein